jgi:hypothetical protein
MGKGLHIEIEHRCLDFAAEHLKFIKETGMNLALTWRYNRAVSGA